MAGKVPLVFGMSGESESVGILTPSQAAVLTGETAPTSSRLAQAIAVISVAIDRDLSDMEWVNSLSGADQRRLRSAIAFTAVSDIDFSGSTGQEVSSRRTGDETITYKTNTGSSGNLLPPLAVMMLSQLSWRRGGRNTMFARTPGYLPYDESDPFAVQPIVRPPLPESAYWHPINEWA